MKGTKLWILGTLAAMCGCVADDAFTTFHGNEAEENRIRFSVESTGRDEIEVTSRASAAEEYEKKIYSLRILVFDKNGLLIPPELFREYDKNFDEEGMIYTLDTDEDFVDADGNLITPSSATAYDDHRGFSIPVMPAGGATYDGKDYDFSACEVWAFANIGRWQHSSVGNPEGTAPTDTVFNAVKTIDDLRNLYGRRNKYDINVSRDFMPMVGTYFEGTATAYPAIDAEAGGTTSKGVTFLPASKIDLTQKTDIGHYKVIRLNQIVSKVTFDVSVSNGYEFYFNTWTVENMARYTFIVPHCEDFADKVTGGVYQDGETDVSKTLQHGLYYPDAEKTDEVEGVLHTGAGWIGIDKDTPDTCQTYSFYAYGNRRGGRSDTPVIDNLGGDNGSYPFDSPPTDETKTNPRYKTLYAPQNASFLVLTGLVRKRGEAVVHSFKYKVALGANNYDDYNLRRNTEYIYHIHIRGTTQDDVTVDVESNFNSAANRRYALEVVAPYSEEIDCHFDKRYFDILAAKGTLSLQLCNEDSTAFTGDWFKIGNISDNGEYANIGLDANSATSMTVEYGKDKSAAESNPENKHFCLYASENTTKDVRKALLKITHTAAEGVSSIVQSVTRYIPFVQYPPIEVTVGGKTLWVENFEEYAMSLLPSRDDDYSEEGLRWGWEYSDSDYHDFSNSTSSDDGLANTTTIVGTSCTAHNAEVENPRWNDYAARYCYHKSQRNAEGSVVSEQPWYLPSIEELKGLTSTNGIFEMRDKEYWSSSVPTQNDVETTTGSSGWDDFLRWIRNAIGIEIDEYRGMAKGAENGEEKTRSVQPLFKTYYYHPVRTDKLHVRAVRVAPTQ